jgi:hypothetical protein
MADLTRLQSATDAAESRYAPLSWLAVTAVAVGGIFVIVILVLAGMALWGGKTLYIPQLLVIPCLGILLAFAARRSIRNSEGARSGTEYANVGWWLCVISGLLFFAYLWAMEFSIRSDAERQLLQWADSVLKCDPTNPNDPATREAFLKTIDPGKLESAEVKDPRVFEATYSLPFASFRQCSLLVIAARNRDTARIIPKGLVSWDQQEGEIQCQVAGILSCAEGDFPITLPMKSMTSGKRKWQILGTDKYIPEDPITHKPVGTRTRYGWVLDRVNDLAMEATTDFSLTLLNQQPRQPVVGDRVQFVPPVTLGQALAIETFITGELSKDGLKKGTQFAELVLLSSFGRLVLLGGSGSLWGKQISLPDSFFAREDGKPISAEDRRTLASCFDPKWPIPERLTPPGRKNKAVTLGNSLIFATDSQITVKTAIELKPDTGEFLTNPQMYTVGRLVFVCDDPELIKDLAQAKQSQSSSSQEPPADLKSKTYRLRVVGIESNLPKMSPPSQRSSPGPEG